MNVAQAYPPRTDSNGVTWYKPAVDMVIKGKPKPGWTSNRDYAHPDYQEEPVTTLPDDLPEDIDARTTEWEGYELPPEPPRFKPQYSGYQYLVPSVADGRRKAKSPRATTISKTLSDEYNLNRWRRRETAARVLQVALLPRDTPIRDTTAGRIVDGLRKRIEGDKVTDFDKALDLLDDMLGGNEANERGTSVHAWMEALDLGQVLYKDLPEWVMPYADAYLAILARFGLVAVPEYVERIVLNDRGDETVVGQIDRIYLCVSTGDLILGDLKTSKTTSLQYAWLEYAVQLGVYGWARHMISTDGTTWGPMPKLLGIPHHSDHAEGCPLNNEDLFDGETCVGCGSKGDPRQPFAILVHLPSDDPAKAQAITFDLTWGAETLVRSIEARTARKEAKTTVPFRHAIPVPNDHALRYVEARQALMKITTADEGEAVYNAYQDVWDDDLGEFAGAVSELV